MVKLQENNNKLILYHNTTNENALKINEEGIKTGIRNNVYGKGNEAEGNGIWCRNYRTYGNGGATITFEISEDDETLWKANDTEYVVYRDIKPEEIKDIDLVITDIPTNGHNTVESDIPRAIEKFGKQKVIDILENRSNRFISPYNADQLKYLIDTGKKYCKGTIKVETKLQENKYVLKGIRDGKTFDIAYGDSQQKLQKFKEEVQPGNPNITMWIDDIRNKSMTEGLHLYGLVKDEDGNYKTIEDNDYPDKKSFENDLRANGYIVRRINDNRDNYIMDHSDYLSINNIKSEITKLKKDYNYYKENGLETLCISTKSKIDSLQKLLDEANKVSLTESHKLEEVSRDELKFLTKSQTKSRMERADNYRGFSIKDVNTDSLLTRDALAITCNVGKYYDTVELENVLHWIQFEAEKNKNKVNVEVINKALLQAIDGLDIKVDCTCPDFIYRFKYKASDKDYNYGREERRPAKITNPNNYGALCFVKGTEIVTNNGLVPIEDIKIGDLVFTHKGRLKKVTDIGKRTTDKLLKLHIGTQDIYCTEEHPFLTCNDRGKDFKFEDAKDIGKNNWRVCVSPILKLSNDCNIDENYAFMLGLYLSDGTLSLRSDMEQPTLCSGIKIATSLDLKDVYDSKLNELGFDYSFHKGSTGKSCYYYIKSTELRDFVYKFGGMNYHNDYSKCISSEVLNWNDNAKLALIKGFFAGDGQYCSNGKYLNMRFLNTNKNIIDMLIIIMKSLGIRVKASSYSRKPRAIANNDYISQAKDMYCITVCGYDIHKINDDWFKLIKGQKSQSYPISNYKSKIFNNEDVEYFRYNVKYITTINEPVEVYNISVDGDDSYLVSKDMIAVHNCKHLYAMLTSKEWIKKAASPVMDWFYKRIDEVNKFLRTKPGEELTLPDEETRQQVKATQYGRLSKRMERIEELAKEFIRAKKNFIFRNANDKEELREGIIAWLKFNYTDEETGIDYVKADSSEIDAMLQIVLNWLDKHQPKQTNNQEQEEENNEQ